MPQYYSLTEEIYDCFDELQEDKATKLVKVDGSIVWKIGKREFGTKYQNSFEDLVLRGMLQEIVNNVYFLSEDGKHECRKFLQINA